MLEPSTVGGEAIIKSLLDNGIEIGIETILHIADSAMQIITQQILKQSGPEVVFTDKKIKKK